MAALNFKTAETCKKVCLKDDLARGVLSPSFSWPFYICAESNGDQSPVTRGSEMTLTPLQNSLREVLADKWKIPLDQSNAPHSICWACVCVVECACARMRSWVLFTLGKLSHAIWSRALREPPTQPLTHTSTSQHWGLLEEARCYLTKTCWRQCV